jgi:D-alanyl-lipoteichoic acid acyltransferase DltB (MBOAT superfamily)
MLFNSFGFVFLYLPGVLAGYFVAGRLGHRAAIAWLAAASLGFYAWWDVRYLPLLLGSILFNHAMARAMLGVPGEWRRAVLVLAVVADLALLGWFKYVDFFLGSVGLAPLQVVLPIGISFFTFTQIAFLVDCYRGTVRECGLTHYALFVSYFPHLVAGPVLHHKEMMPQFADPANARPRSADLAVGLTIFVLGLAKKVLIADNLAPLANPVFAAGAHPALLEAWTGVLAYTFQLYFDFSGYSDMAIGLSRMFRIRLPLNFNAPYKARDIADFWRRWHITLSRFLREYLYIPLGGKQGGAWRRARNLMLTMLLGGLWHGAGWTFVAWGGLHGLYLIVHRLWEARGWPLPPRLAHGLTFGAVMLAWVFFRAPDFAVAADVLWGMAGGHGLSLPTALRGVAGWLPGATFSGLRWIDPAGPTLPALGLAMVLALHAPTTLELVERRWRPSPGWRLACTALLVAALFNISQPTEFLYFQF